MQSSESTKIAASRRGAQGAFASFPTSADSAGLSGRLAAKWHVLHTRSRQEKWVAAHIGRIQAAMIAVGAAFDFHAGTLPQAPKILQDYGLEWLFRLVNEPGRLWRRYLILNPLFVLNFSQQLIKSKVG